MSIATPIPVRRAIRQLGKDIRNARRKRRIPTTIMAERASISRTTLAKIESGEPNVSMANYATVLFVLGLIDKLGEVAHPGLDDVALALEEERLPKRIHLHKEKE